MVITGSQVFGQVEQDVAEPIPLTSFPILFARYKGNLQQFFSGVDQLSRLKAHDQVFSAETLLQEKLGILLVFSRAVGDDFPIVLPSYKLVIPCDVTW